MKNDDDLLPGGKNDPFIVPQGFFEEFKYDLLHTVDQRRYPKAVHYLRIASKYAAILCVLFFAGKGVISTFLSSEAENVRYSETAEEIDLIYQQIPESEFTDYILEMIEEDISAFVEL